ncbi:DUF4143 domain-containing protein [Myxococcota bacterium]|nr:DUF4143 domain-containing protein [Myxococcota bacterium]
MRAPYLPRLVDPVLRDLLADLPAVMLTGPRATGKTTTAARLARSVVHLDRPEEAAVAAADPDAVLRGREPPVLIDEWQAVPSILGAVKRAIDRDPVPGRFLVTGSARSELAPDLWPGTGRLVRVPLYGLTTRERVGAADRPGLMERIVQGGLDAVEPPADPPDLRGYVTELLTSGFPQPAVHLPPSRREIWLSSYLDQVITRDAATVDHGRDPVKLRRFLETLAVNTAGVVDDATLCRTAGINRRTAQAYEALLTDLSLVDTFPGWWSNRTKRLVQRPKRFLVDAALAAAAVGIDEDGILRDAAVLGRLLETFVAAQVRAELPASRVRARLYHLRTEQGRQEVDILAELPRQDLVALEVKATSAPGRADARHLAWLRDEVGDRFVAGLVLHAGARVFRLDDRIAAVPIACLWS